MKPSAWNAGIVGCGRIAGLKDRPRKTGAVWTHAQGYRRHPRFKLTACMNPTAEHLQRFRRLWKIPSGYRSLGEMLAREHLDVISLCSPSEFHAAQAGEILASPRRPRLLFLEKPVCLREEQAADLAAAGRNTQTEILINHNRRFDPAHQKLSRLIQSGKFGKLVEARCTYYGGWLNNGAHLVDTLLMLFPSSGITVLASRLSGHGRGDDDNLDLDLRVGDAPVSIRGFDETHYQLFEMELRFQKGRLRLLDAGFQIAAEKVLINKIGERVLAPLPGIPTQGLASPMEHAVKAIAKILQGRGRASDWNADLSSALKTMQVLWKARAMAGESAAACREVEHVG